MSDEITARYNMLTHDPQPATLIIISVVDYNRVFYFHLFEVFLLQGDPCLQILSSLQLVLSNCVAVVTCLTRGWGGYYHI